MPVAKETVDPAREQRAEAIAQVWQSATADLAYIPYPTNEIRARYRQLVTDALDALANLENADALIRRGRDIGRAVVELNLTKPEALERTLDCLGRELAGDYPAERLARFLVGLAGGFMAATESTLLAQQEAIGRAATAGLKRAQTELEVSRDKLAESNRALSAQIEERIRAEETQREYAERLKRLHELDLAILSAESLPAIAEISIDYLHSHISALHAFFVMFELADRQSIVLMSDNAHYPAGRRLSISQIEPLQVMQEGNLYYLPDLQSVRDRSPGLAEIAESGGRSLVAVPLKNRQELIGALIVILDEVRQFSQGEIAIALEIADSTAVAIQNRSLLQAEQVARQRETTLREVAASLTQGLDLDAVLQHILHQLDRVIASRSSAILLLEDGIPSIASHRGSRITPEQASDILSKRPESIWSILATAQPKIINDTLGTPSWYVVPDGEYIRSWMGVPLMVKGKCIGVLTIDRDRPHAFTTQDMELAMTFAHQAAIAIENARLFRRQQEHAEDLEKRVQDRTRELEVLYNITNAAVVKSDMEDLLRRSLELSIEAFGGTRGAIHLVEEDGNDLRLAVCLGLEGQGAGLINRLSDDDPRLTGALQSGSLSIYTAKELPAEWLAQGIKSLAVAPLRSLDHTLGVISLANDQPDRFTDAAQQLLKAIADQIGAAVENINLRRLSRQAAVMEERERLAGDLHDAVTQTIYSASLFAEAARESLETGNLTRVRQHTQSVLRMTDQALRELRVLLFELRTETLARKGLEGALKERFQMVEHRAGIMAEVYAPELANLPVALEDAYYRVALEALNNALRHARAANVDIILTEEKGDLVMVIADDGVGFDLNNQGLGGMGLGGMKKRIHKVGGHLVVISRPGMGTRITVRAPLGQPAP